MTTQARDPQSVDPRAVIAFWRAAGPTRWFNKSETFDAEVGRRLGSLHYWAAAGMLDHLATKSAQGALALILLLDQIPRNMFRGSARAFATDEHAREIASYAITRGLDQRVPRSLRGFFYLPFMHSEQLGDQQICLALYERLKDKQGLKYAEIHLDIIKRFGRFPHRNDALGRETTKAEQQFLNQGGFAG